MSRTINNNIKIIEDSNKIMCCEFRYEKNFDDFFWACIIHTKFSNLRTIQTTARSFKQCLQMAVDEYVNYLTKGTSS